MKKNFYCFILILGVLSFSCCISYGQLHLPTIANVHQPHGFIHAPHHLIPTNLATNCSSDSIRFTRQSQIDSFPILNPMCTALRKLIIDGTGASPAITRLDSLRQITQVSQNLSISHTSVTSLSSFANLSIIGDSLLLMHNPLLTSTGLNNISQLGSLYFIDLPVLTSMAGLSNHITSFDDLYMDSTGITDLSGLSGISHINSNIQIDHSPLTSLAALNNLTYIQGWLWLDNDTSMVSIGLTNLTQCSFFLFSSMPNLTSMAGISYHLTNFNVGTFWMISTGLTDLTGLDSLTSAPNFYIDNNPNLVSLHGLEKLNGDIGSGFAISGNSLLTDMSALSHITSINNSTLEISYNNSLTNLVGVGNITNIGGGLWIIDNEQLPSLANLNNNLVIQNTALNNNNLDSVRIIYNFQLSVCSSPPICNYLNTSSSAEIHDNAPGCSSIAEIIANCNNPCNAITDVTWNGNTSQSWSDSTNWTPAVVPGICNKVIIPGFSDVPNTPLANSNISIGGLEMVSQSILDMGLFNLYVANTVNLDNANIDNLGNLIAKNIVHPTVYSSVIQGNFTCQSYTGAAEFTFNTINGNTLLSDSSARTATSNTYLNTFYGDLTLINNSNYGNNYLSNASPGHDYVQGNLTVINNSTANISVGLGGGNPLDLTSNFIVHADSGRIDINNLTFIGNAYNHITQTGSIPITINNLYVQTGQAVILDQNVYINNSLNFLPYEGPLVSDTNKLLILNNGCTVSGASNIAFVKGPVKKIGNQAFTFPIGKVEQGTVWSAPLSITAPALATDEFTAEYFHHSAGIDGYDTALVSPGFGGVQGKEYWKLDRNNGNSKVKVTLPYDGFRSGTAYNYQYIQVAGWNGNLWKSWGSGGFSGNVYSGSLISQDSLSGYGPLTFSFKPVRKPIITIGNIDTLYCIGHYVNIPFSLDTAMDAGNSFHVEISDTLGNFNNLFNPSIGSKSSITSDTIQTLNYFMISGKHYKLRVVGSLVPDTSINIKTVTAIASPQISVNIVGPNPACPGVQKYYPNVHEANVTYTWSVSGGGTITTTGDTAFVNWTTPGAYNLTVQSSNQCGNGPQSTVYSLIVNPPPPSAIPVINNTGRWIYASQAPAASGYTWLRNGVLITGAINASYYASQAGNYTVNYSDFCGNGPLSNTINFASASVPQTISFAVPPNKTYGDAPFTPVATSSSGLPVAFTIISGPATINTQTSQVTITGTGIVSIRADQQGDNTYDTAAPVIRTFVVNKATQIIDFPVIANQNYSSSPISLSATASSGLSTTYSIVSGPASVSGNQLLMNGVGTITVRSSQNGDTNYLPATPVDRSFCSRVSSLNPISGYTNLCPGVATYAVNNIQGATYFWRIAGGATIASTTSTANITWTTPGLYTLLVSATGSCGAGSSNDTLVVNVINSIQPDSVHSMLPANGAINQQLPLLMSWVPAQPNSFYTFDLYIWRADTSQPAAPFVANLTTVNYTLQLNSGLVFNRTYKWMVVAHNGSCTVIHTGPIQQFTLIPLPDLVVSNVQIPATAFSGQSISINWKVSNAGPGKTTTNQSWTDAVFLSFDTLPNFNIPPNTNPAAWSQLNFPLRPLLVGTRPNLTALDSGQFYNNTINFTLPVNYNQPLYAYVITNYPAASNAPLQVTNLNDTSRASQPIAVTLSPTPDLRVDTVFTPSTTFSGSTINVTYKVKNYGVLTPAGAVWTDKIYISQSPLFNINTAIPLNFPKGNGTYYANAFEANIGNFAQLQADSFYTRSVQVVVPNYIFGTYFIYVFTNAAAQVYEGALSGNNINRSQVQVFLTPTPHLIVSSLIVPLTTASTTQPLGVSWTISNTGFNDNIEMNKGHYYVYAGTCLIPPPPCTGPPGTTCYPQPPTHGISIRDSVSFGSSYWKDRVYLSTDSTTLNTNTALLVNETIQGQQYSGLYIDDNYNMIYPCQTLGTNPGVYNLNTFNVIRPGSTHPKAAGFNIPDNLPPGNYYVYVLTNATNDVYEYPGTPETRRSDLPIAIQRPDATVSSLTAPSSAVGGQPVILTYNILNIGPGGVYNHVRKDNIYVSTSPVFNGSAQLISTQIYTEDLPVGINVSHTVNYSFPVSTSGTRYFYVYTNFDSSFRETNPNNNVSAGVAISISPAIANDLVVTSFQVADSAIGISPVRMKYTVQNNGSGVTAGTWTDSLFISCTPTFNSATSYYIGKRTHSDIVHGGGTYSDSFNLSLSYLFDINSCFPQTIYNSAWFFVKTNADNVVFEGTNTSNNITGSGLKTVINALVDHTVTIVSTADTATVARPFLTSWTVKNVGYNASVYNYYYYYAWYDGVYFSPDSVFNANAVLATSFYESTVLNQNQTYSESRNAIPPNLPTGDYYVYAYSNNTSTIYGERIFTNNANLVRNSQGAAKKIHLIQPLLPDLVDSILSAPALVAVGQPLAVVSKISNTGAGVTYPNTWSDNIWLSTDFIPNNGNDLQVSGVNHSGVLQPGQSFNDTSGAVIPLNFTPGNYVLIGQVNSGGNVVESNTANNLAFRYVTIYSPAPSDLLVENIIKPDTVFLGYTLDTAKWVIKNNSPNTASGISSDGIYLSSGSTLDSTAILLGIKNKTINMAPLGRDTIVLQPLVNNVVEGNYNVFVKTDVLNNIVESDKTNNTSMAAGNLHVSVKELPMNVLTANTLFNINRFYKLIIADSLSGATIQVTLKSDDSLSMKNQMFIGKGYVPSAANFDYTYNTPNYGNQQIVITSVTAGVYYITFRCVSPNPLVQNITIKAVKLPFALLNVQSSSGGNTGNVTVKLSGSLFTPNMVARLTKPGTTITSSLVYFTNSTIVYATFNLQGKPLGIYDVTLIKPDTTSAILPASFSIVNANNGGLITGGGINTGPSGTGNDPGCDPGAPSGLNSQLVTEIVAPNAVFATWPFVIQINYNNPTNVDIPAQVRVLYSERNILMSYLQQNLATGTTSLEMELTEQDGPPGIIRAGGSGTITIYAKAPINIPGHTLVYFKLK